MYEEIINKALTIALQKSKTEALLEELLTSLLSKTEGNANIFWRYGDVYAKAEDCSRDFLLKSKVSEELWSSLLNSPEFYPKPGQQQYLYAGFNNSLVWSIAGDSDD